MNSKVTDNIAALQNGKALLRNLSDAAYISETPSVFNSTVGSHIRHNLDHYACFLAGLDSGIIDYTARKRNSRVENDREIALAEFSRICRGLEAVTTDKTDLCLLVERDTGPSQTSTSLVRELEFLLSHTIHHYAIVAIICRLQGIFVDDDFGIAPSTLHYRASQITKRPAYSRDAR